MISDSTTDTFHYEPNVDNSVLDTYKIWVSVHVAIFTNELDCLTKNSGFADKRKLLQRKSFFNGM